MEAFWLTITNLGRDEVFIVVLALYTWLVRPRGGRDLGVAFALSYLVNTALKYGLDLPRPFTHDPTVASEAAKRTAGGSGLPSGHAQMAATLGAGIASQVGRTGTWVLALILIALIAASRLILHAHFPLDVFVALLIGAAFAWLAARGRFPQAGAMRWLLPLILLGAAAFLPTGTPREYGTGLGLLAGFWWARPNFTPPQDVAGRLSVGVVGLMIVFAVYFGLGALPQAVKDVSVVRVLRYALLVLVATEVVPALLRRWMPRMEGTLPAREMTPGWPDSLV